MIYTVRNEISVYLGRIRQKQKSYWHFPLPFSWFAAIKSVKLNSQTAFKLVCPKCVLLFKNAAQDALKIACSFRCHCVCIAILCEAHMCIYVPCFRSNQNAYFTYERIGRQRTNLLIVALDSIQSIPLYSFFL